MGYSKEESNIDSYSEEDIVFFNKRSLKVSYVNICELLKLVKCVLKTMSQQISDKEILTLWHSVLFSGSFTGIKTFQTCLKLEKDIDVSESRLYSILKKDSLFLIHQKRHKELDRRHLGK